MKAFWKLRKDIRLASACLAMVLVWGLVSQVAVTQDGPRPIGAQPLELGLISDHTLPTADIDWETLRKENGEKYSGGAALKTDPELEELLERAALFAKEGSYRNATLLWQKVLSESGDSLITRDGETYFSLSSEVVRTIAQLPAEGLQVYRITADGEAQAILAQADQLGLEAAYSKIVREYFLSSLGDEAALNLGSIALDRFDFVGASRIFTRVLTEYPDPSFPREEVLLRLAVAAAYLGDHATAKTAMEQASASSTLDDQRLAAIRQAINTAEQQSYANQPAVGRRWPMRLGSPSRHGVMPALPAEAMSSDLTKMWTFEFPLDFSAAAVQANYGMVFFEGGLDLSTVSGADSTPVTTSNKEKRMIQRWQKSGWQPSGHLLLDEGRIFFKTNNDLTCWNQMAKSDQPVWRSLWLNDYQMDEATAMLRNMLGARGRGSQAKVTRPTEIEEVMLFGDRVHHSMSIVNGVIYNIEGRRYSRYGQPPKKAGQRQGHMPWGQIPRRSRTNWLTAYDSKTGKLLWHRGASEHSEEGQEDGVGFMAAPVPFGTLLLAPVTEGGAIWIYAMDSENKGKTIWRTYLCDEPMGGARHWSPVGISIEGRDAYVVCGTGVVFALDVLSGDIRFARRYIRNGKPNRQIQQYTGQSSLLDLQGWDEDVVIPHGNALIIMASDHDELLALDRRSGKMLWRAPRHPFEDEATYCLGVYQEGLYVGGKNLAMCYDLKGQGKLKWVQSFDGICGGRGMLTADAVYMPVKDSIVKLDLQTGQPLKRVGVQLTDGSPVGNLYSDGEKIWVVGGHRLYALTSLEQQLIALERWIGEGSLPALQQRFRLFAKIERFPEAIGDLKRLFERASEQTSTQQAAQLLYNELFEFEVGKKAPVLTLQLLLDLVAENPDQLGPSFWSSYSHFVFQTLENLSSSAHPETTATMLMCADLIDDEVYRRKLGHVLNATVAEVDTPRLLHALEKGSDAEKIVAAPAAARLGDSAAESLLNQLLQADSDAVRLVAARELINKGQREPLETLVQLLDSETLRVRIRSVRMLRRLSNQSFRFEAHLPADQRSAAIQSWRNWVETSGDTSELVLPLSDAPVTLGRTLLVFADGQVVEFDSGKNEVWRKQVHGAYAVQGLPNGHRLVSSIRSRSVFEYDQEGNEVWKVERVVGQPIAVQRLDNGNTLVVCVSPNKVLEYGPDKKIVWQIDPSSQPRHAQRLENGNTLVVLGNQKRLIEVDPKGEIVWKLEELDQMPWRAERLENGNFLVAFRNASRVDEITPDGKIVWSKDGLPLPMVARRLVSGNTLIGYSQGIMEVDSSGKQVWRPSGGRSTVTAVTDVSSF